MDTHSRAQWIVAVLLGVGALSFPVFADEVYTYSGDFNLQIPAEPDTSKGWMADAVIQVSDPFTIYDLDVGITLTHSSVFDLQIFLQSPEGTRLCLNMYEPLSEFFQGEDYTQTVFDDEAEVPIEEAEPPFTGRFKPKAGNLLEIFDHQDAYGPWRLQIYDAYYADTGTFENFELTLTVPEPATVALLVLGAGLAALLRPRRRR
jgi:subtilisin-like proprotein convertase family protein